jgi:lysine-specific histone demethylase 1
LERNEGVYGPDGPPLDDKLAQRLNFNVTRAFFSDSATYAQDSPNGVPTPGESLGGWMKDEKRTSLFAGLKTERDKAYALALAESWEGYSGAALDQISLRYWHSEVTFRGPDATFVDGYEGIYSALHADIVKSKHGDVQLGEVVEAIALSEDEETVRVTASADGKETTYSARYVVCTLPLGVLQHSPPRFSPPLPKRRLAATHRLGHGLLNKIIVAYPRAFWPDTEFFGLLPSKLSAAFLPILKSRALMVQNLRIVNGQPALLFFMGGAAGQALENVSDEHVRKHIHKIIAHHFACHTKSVPEPEAVVVTRWNSDPFSRGSYSFLPPGSDPQDFRELARPLWGDRLLFAGEATDPDHYVSVRWAKLTTRRPHTARTSLARGRRRWCWMRSSSRPWRQRHSQRSGERCVQASCLGCCSLALALPSADGDRYDGRSHCSKAADHDRHGHTGGAPLARSHMSACHVSLRSQFVFSPLSPPYRTSVEQQPHRLQPCACHCNAEPPYRPNVEGRSALPTAHSDQAPSKVNQPDHASEPIQVALCGQVGSNSLTIHAFPFDSTPRSIDTQDQCSSAITAEAASPAQDSTQVWLPFQVPALARRPAQVGAGSQHLHIYSFTSEAHTAGQIYEEGS